MKNHAAFLSIFLLPLLTACDPVQVVGRIGFGETFDCALAMTSQEIHPSNCSALKRRFNPETGDPIRSYTVMENAARPLTATIRLELWEKEPPAGELGVRLKRRCGIKTVQSDRDGFFNAKIPGCGEGVDTLLIGTALLQATIQRPGSFDTGTIRATWQDEQAFELFPELSGYTSAVPRFYWVENGTSTRYSMPYTGFVASLGRQPATTQERPALINSGTHILLDQPSSDEFGYFRQALSAFQTLVELHTRFAEITHHGPHFRNLYGTESISGWTNNYMVWLNNTWAYGWGGGLALHRPDRALFESSDRGAAVSTYTLSNVGTLAHEFGHSIHFSNATVVQDSHYHFAGKKKDESGEFLDVGHGPAQYQEMGTAMVEGFATSLGQYLINKCNGWKPTSRLISGGVRNFEVNQWGMRTSNSIESFRYHMDYRGFEEDSSTYSLRRDRLARLTTYAIDSRHELVTSNSEARTAELFCDLMDSDSNVSYYESRNKRYVPNFTFYVGEILDGVDISNPPLAQYPDTRLTAETTQIHPDYLLAGMANYCENCGEWEYLDYGSEFNRRRLQASGGEGSPQTFLRYLKSLSILSPAESEALLRANLMELEE